MKEQFSTANLARGDKFDFWHEIVCKQFVTADSVKDVASVFDAELACNKIGQAQVSRFDAPAHKWRRNRKHIKADDQDVYLLGVLRNGEGKLEQNGNTVIQKKGGLALYDTSLPFSYDLDASINILSLPRNLLDSRAPHAHRMLAKNLECDPGLAAMLCEMIDALLEMDVSQKELSLVRERLSNSLVDIVLAILDLNTASLSSESGSNPGMERMLTYARANLGDPDLSPSEIAKFGAVSTRTMNRLFGKLGTTPMRWVLQERVRLGERYLHQGYAKSVTEAAFMVGFNDISHFSRSFKQFFGHPPETVLKGR
jgi:AraC-like DNA-binding protein